MKRSFPVTFETVEPRQLLSGEHLDTTFGTNGHVALPSNLTLNGMLATHGSIFLDVYNHKKDRRLIYKYTDAGVLDTAWGKGGYIVPAAVTSTKDSNGQYSAVTMVYDPRTKGLVVGFADGDVIDFERRAADGSFDPAWGTNGRLEYLTPGSTITLRALTPLAGKRLLVAFDSTRTASKTVRGTIRYTGTTAVNLMRIDRHGRFDKTFAGDGVANVQVGSTKQIDTPSVGDSGTLAEDLDQQTFGDVQVRADGSYRVLTVRTLTSAVQSYDRGFDQEILEHQSGKAVTTLSSLNVSSTGKVSVLQTYTLHRERFTNTSLTYRPYTVELARAVGSNGVAVLGQDAQQGQATITNLTPTTQPPARPLAANGADVFQVNANNPGGKVFITTISAGPSQVGRYNSDLSLATGFATGGMYTETSGFAIRAGDDEGRLVGVNATGDMQRLT